MEIADAYSSSMEEDTPSVVDRLDSGLAGRIFNYLDEPMDLAFLTAVSRSCRRIVVESRCFKDLCIRICPEVSSFNSVMEEDKKSIFGGPSSSKDFAWTNLNMEHRVYGKLAHELIKPPVEKTCICGHICASSTDNYPRESVIFTLDPRIKKNGRPSYWSSKGESSRDVSETLTYRLHKKLSVVHEVKIRPFQAYFQRGTPIYSANAVRFRFGYSISSPGIKSSVMDGSMSSDISPCEDYVWTYISQEYPMLQEDELQSFKLPRPVLCIGDILQVELLGRVQRQEIDQLYYICVCHVYVVGRPLSSITFEVQGQPGQYILKYLGHQGHPEMPFEDTSGAASQEDETGTSSDDQDSDEDGNNNFIFDSDNQDSDEDGDINLFLDSDNQDSNEDDNINLFLD